MRRPGARPHRAIRISSKFMAGPTVTRSTSLPSTRRYLTRRSPPRRSSDLSSGADRGSVLCPVVRRHRPGGRRRRGRRDGHGQGRPRQQDRKTGPSSWARRRAPRGHWILEALLGANGLTQLLGHFIHASRSHILGGGGAIHPVIFFVRIHGYPKDTNHRLAAPVEDALRINPNPHGQRRI